MAIFHTEIVTCATYNNFECYSLFYSEVFHSKLILFPETRIKYTTDIYKTILLIIKYFKVQIHINIILIP